MTSLNNTVFDAAPQGARVGGGGVQEGVITGLTVLYGDRSLTNTTHWINDGSMLGQRRRRCPNIKPLSEEETRRC